MAQERNDLERSETTDGSILDVDEATDSFNLSGDEENSEHERTELIKEQIDETRSQMGETIDAIQDKLSFSNLSEQVSEPVNNAVETAKDAVYEATIGKAANIMKSIGSELSSTSIVRTAKNNPFPFILIGLGAGLLAYQTYAGGSSSARRRLPVAGRDPNSDAQNTTLVAARDTLSGVTGKVSDVTGDALSKVSGAVGTAYSGAGDAVHYAYDKAGALGTTVRQQYDTQIQDHPLAVGAVALALGAAVGMAIPATRYEADLMGNARNELFGKAQAKASELLDTAKEAATEAGRSVGVQAKSAIH